MKRSLFVFAAVLGVFEIFAFDSAKWLVRREAMTKDAERLRAAYSNAVGRIDSPSEGITIPFELFPDGSVRTSIYAEKAQIYQKSPLIWAEGLTLIRYDDEGKEKHRLEAGSCIIDRMSKSGWVEGHAKVTQGKTSFEGDGVYFSSSNNFVSAYSKSDIRSEDLRFGGLK